VREARGDSVAAGDAWMNRVAAGYRYSNEVGAVELAVVVALPAPLAGVYKGAGKTRVCIGLTWIGLLIARAVISLRAEVVGVVHLAIEIRRSQFRCRQPVLPLAIAVLDL
jgi:hypothetical protein